MKAEPLVFYCYPGPGPLVPGAAELLEGRGWTRSAHPLWCDLAVAPCLRKILGAQHLSAPRVGTLVFHPSLLPRHRGPDAVKWQVLGGECFGGVSWFWADEGLDTGDVCEQEVVALHQGKRPREIYDEVFVPAGLRSLVRIAEAVERGFVRRVKQDEGAATYESWWGK